MITKLTKEQESKLTEYRDKWIKIGLSTEPTNQTRALTNVKAYYEAGGLVAPEVIVFAKSPYTAMILANILSSKDFWVSVNVNLTKPTTNVVKFSKKDEKIQSIFNSIKPDLQKAVNQVVGKELNIDGVMKDAIKASLNKWNGNYARGNLWPAWISFYDYFHQVLNIKGTEKIKPTADLALDCGWIFPYSTFCVLTEKPTEIHMNTRGQLHNEHGMSIKWADGFGIYSLSGVTVPSWVIETKKDEIDSKKVLALPTEQRFATMRFFGLSRFLGVLNAKELDRQDEYVLYSLTVEGTKIGPYLFMKCPSSGREFLEGVGSPEKHEAFDTTITTCEKALLWRAERASKNLMTKFSLNLKYHT